MVFDFNADAYEVAGIYDAIDGSCGLSFGQAAVAESLYKLLFSVRPGQEHSSGVAKGTVHGGKERVRAAWVDEEGHDDLDAFHSTLGAPNPLEDD